MSSAFHPIRRLATGGMAEVYLAMQLGIEGFEKLVVLKQILPHLRQDDEFVEMFLEEARLAASLRHQNVVETLDIHRDEDNLFIAMEYISGEDLRYLLAKLAKSGRRIPVPVACRILADVAAGLEYAHTATDVLGQPRGIVHRDVGPSNILVDYQGISRLADFGIAKADAANVYTKPGVLKGKFGYMAPEHVRHQKLDHRADVFALGVVMHEVLTGRRLFKEPTLAGVVQALVEKVPPPPSSVNPEVPPSLDAVVVAALVKDRAARTQTAREVREQLERVLGEFGPATHHDVAQWMQTTFPDRVRSRQTLEREVVLEGRQLARGGGEVDAGDLAMLPLSNTSARLDSSAGARTAGSGSQTGATTADGSGSRPGLPTGARTPFPSAPDTGSQSYREGTGPGSQSYREGTGPGSQGTGPGSQSSAPGTGAPPSEPRLRRSMIALVAAVLALLVVVGVMAGFLLGRGRPEPVAAGSSGAQREAGATTTGQTATLIVHVHPKGARLQVAGKTFDDVGPSGTMVPVAAHARIRLSIAKAGFGDHVEVVELQPGTTEHVHVNLRVAVAAGLVDNTTAGAPPSTPGATSQTTAQATARSATTRSATARSAARPVVHSSTRRAWHRPARHAVRRKQTGSTVAPVTGALIVSYSPAQAIASLDGRVIGRRSPARLDDVAAGTHRLSLTAAGFKPALHTLTVVAGNEHRLSFELARESEPAMMDFISSPAGAAVTVDGVSRGRTPLLGLRLSANRPHLVRVALAGHEVWSSHLTPTDGRNPPIVATLRPLPGAAPPTLGAAGPESPAVVALIVPGSSSGDAGRGRSLFGSRCGMCHGKSAAAISTKRYTRAQWSRYFANGRHEVRAPLAKHLSRTQLAHVKAFLMSRAADVESATAAGVR